MAGSLQLPIIDLASSDCISTSSSIRQACMNCGFFYLTNHGVEGDLLCEVLEGNKKFFELPLEEKMKLARKENRGYTPLYAENLDPSSSAKGDSKESFYIGSLEDTTNGYLNQWPPDEILPCWRSTMENYYKKVLEAGKRLISLVALALDLEENFFYDIGALNQPNSFLRLLHYPGDLGLADEETYGASAHSDYGMITLLATDGVGGLQVCREKAKEPRVWEDVHYVPGAFIVNIGDMMERWTNGLFRSTLHRVMPTGQMRYSMAFFLDPNPDCVVECLKTCCSESYPPRFPPIRSGDYMEERFKLTYGS
ncbi:1-aminocyclopropane-1-carboxylate oxidase-like isoform X1 [Olea europaea subsp. europaea]|uniref:1-aminocyclopropane-1-carboxylate oxidase-like isoform X1 n=1 Tax=Olea europaea subsp. europaea TaxID=158383 RepID=A0A8S0RHW9_OLEEU|nr:1-aminocyclopropane-1-carboxylate oxidase-like isoform X1 [Olea europaea subsp. europaea]